MMDFEALKEDLRQSPLFRATALAYAPDYVRWQFERRAGIEELAHITGETPETIANYMVQHPGDYARARAAIMAGVDLAPYRTPPGACEGITTDDMARAVATI